MNLSPTKLMLGTFALSAIYLLYGPKKIDNYYAFVTMIEAGVYSIIILIAFNIKNIKLWFLFPVIAALLNYVFVIELWPYVVVLPALLSENLNLYNSLYHTVIIFSWYSLLGALFYCFLLDMLVASSQLTTLSYIFVVILCSLAGIAWILEEFNIDWYLAAHKVTWWVMFSIGLLLSEMLKRKNA
ncbi:MAG: hypothetical protein R8G33_07520 [Gammaproteobacteria bacterium]|nr:hypothetical protein [Gammaproteobacteria bacterium]